MASNSTQYALYVSTPQLKVKSRDWGAGIHCASADFAGALLGGAASGCVKMVVIPAGAKILGGQLSWGALGTSQLSVGDEWDCDRFMTLADGSVASNLSVGVTPFLGGTCGRFNNIVGKHYVTTCDFTIIVSNLSGTATSTAVGTATPLTLEVFYTFV